MAARSLGSLSFRMDPSAGRVRSGSSPSPTRSTDRSVPYLKLHQHLLAMVSERGRLSVDEVADALKESEAARLRPRRAPIAKMATRTRKAD